MENPGVRLQSPAFWAGESGRDAPAGQMPKGKKETGKRKAEGMKAFLRGVGRILAWLLLVAVLTGVLVGGVLAFFYSRTGEDKLPQDPVTYGGQALENVGYDWKVPVLGGVLHRRFQLSPGLALQDLGTFDNSAPALALPAWGTRAQVEITDSTGQTTFSGSGEEYAQFRFGANGTYQAKITVWHESAGEKPAKAQGYYVYNLRFSVDAAPSLELSAEHANQGGVIGLRVTGVLGSEPPQLDSDLGQVWFSQTTGGWMAYLPVTYNAEMGEHTLTLTSGSHTLTAQVEVRAADFAKTPEVEAQSWSSAAAQEYRTVIWPLYQQGDRAPQWLGRFTQPVQGSTVQSYGAYLAGGARSTELRVQAADSDEVVAPADGVVVYAGTLQLGGNTVVIDHGCGLKSYLCGLRELSVSEGAQLTQGELVGLAGQEPVTVEMRIGNKSINPVNTFKGQGGLFMK